LAQAILAQAFDRKALFADWRFFGRI